LSRDLPAFRPPAVPLVASDPYFSIWSCTDRLTDDWPRHWTGRTHALCSLIRIDGKPFRLMGAGPEGVPALPQVSVQVLPTQSVYRFAGEGVEVKLSFLSPALPDDLDVYSRPVTYITWSVRATDGREHEVGLYLDACAEIAVNDPSQQVCWGREEVPDLRVVRMGSQEQPVLAKSGDDLRIDWGHLYLAVAEDAGQVAVGGPSATRDAFCAGIGLPADDDPRMPRAADDDRPLLAARMHLGSVGAGTAERTALLAYDDLWSIEYFGEHLRPWWRRDGTDARALLAEAHRDSHSLRERCGMFDDELIADLTASGGAKYAALCALAYRQAVAGCKLVADSRGMPLLWPKENFSNGCMGTVDVIYPMLPQFLLLSPALAKAALAPVLQYAASSRWRFPFAPHDLGTYPLANGQVYGGGEATEDNQMPVEECGNMLILLAAIARAEGNASFASLYWDEVSRWARYLVDKGLDPEHQLCTDDFAGHLAHNVNLSAKAIMALACYGRLCEMRGEAEEAKRYTELARSFASQWAQMADDGDHFRLAFDHPGTWSQKYNLVWDEILGLGIFPPDVRRKETEHYLRVQCRYGLPLDSRQDYTKTDWNVWTATLSGRREDFDALLSPVFEFLSATESRVPMTDWYRVGDAKMMNMQARPVVGGLFIKLLYEEGIWAKWVGRGAQMQGQWAQVPPR